MPQLDFTIWLVNLFTCWTMFFLMFTTTNSIISETKINTNTNENFNTVNNNWPW